MKKFLALILAALMLLSLAACGSAAQGDVQENQNDMQDQEQVQDTTEAEDEHPESQTVTLDTVKNAPETDASLFEYREVDGGIEITSFNGTDSIVAIPEQIDGKDVVTVGDNAFVNNDTVKGVKISSKVQKIGSSAFINCVSLETVVCGESVKEICMYAFNGCKKLTNMELNEGLEVLDGLCFGLTNLTEIEIPSSVKEINYPFTVNYEDHYITVIAESGSVAEQYVQEKGEEYHLIFQAK